MRVRGSYRDARVSGLAVGQTLAGLSGTNAGAVYGVAAGKVKDCYNYAFPSATGSRPDDAIIFSDPYGYLRTVLNNADWNGVARWYATRITEILQRSTRPPEFWDLSKLNLQDHSDRIFNLADLHAFTKLCIMEMCVADYGNKVGFGYQGRTDFLNLAMFFANGLSHNDGQLDWFKSYENAKNGSRYGFCIGWVKEPSKHTASRIIVAVGAAFIGAAAFSALTAPASAATSGATGAAAGGTTAGASAAIIPAGVEVVTVTAAAPIVTAGSVAAGLSAGAVAVAAAPPPLSAPSIETVTVTAAAPATGSVGQALVAGTVATAVAAPALTTPSIETVTVEAPRVEQHPVDPATTAATGLISVGIQYPAIQVRPPNPQYDENSLLDRVKENLQDAASEYGANWIRDNLQRWLTDELGRPPTQTEYEQYQDFIDPNSPGSLLRKWLPAIIGAMVVAALIAAATREGK